MFTGGTQIGRYQQVELLKALAGDLAEDNEVTRLTQRCYAQS